MPAQEKDALADYISRLGRADALLDSNDGARDARHHERLAHTAEGLAGALSSVGLGQMPDLRTALARSDCEVDFLAGGQDIKFLMLARELCGIMPRARLNVAENAGHDLVLERPEFCSDFLVRGRSP
jgi:2-succinyl-6-hydroxy-2,4-cyclohexadiene-1-carboxylate synthase